MNLHQLNRLLWTTMIGLLFGLVSCAAVPDPAPAMAAPYEFEASYVWLSRDEMTAEADAIFVGHVMRFSKPRWNQDSGEYWQGVGANLPYHEITVAVEQSLIDGSALGDEATITVLGGSPAGSIQSENISIADKPEHTLQVGDQAVFFVRSTDLAWRPKPGMQEASRHVTMFMGAPSTSYLTLEDDGLYHSREPQESSTDLDTLVARIAAARP